MTEQIKTRGVTIAQIMSTAEFAHGVEDVRHGRTVRFDQFAYSWEYERGRLFAVLAPLAMPLCKRGKLNWTALALLSEFFDQGVIT